MYCDDAASGDDDDNDIVMQLRLVPVVRINVHCDDVEQRHEISPDIYGLCHADITTLKDLNIRLNRYGGNRSSTYNWRENASNTAKDHYFESRNHSRDPAKKSL
jgi:hypothetical protein